MEIFSVTALVIVFLMGAFVATILIFSLLALLLAASSGYANVNQEHKPHKTTFS